MCGVPQKGQIYQEIHLRASEALLWPSQNEQGKNNVQYFLNGLHTPSRAKLTQGVMRRDANFVWKRKKKKKKSGVSVVKLYFDHSFLFSFWSNCKKWQNTLNQDRKRERMKEPTYSSNEAGQVGSIILSLWGFILGHGSWVQKKKFLEHWAPLK